MKPLPTSGVWTEEDFLAHRCMWEEIGQSKYDDGYAKRLARQKAGAAMDALVEVVGQSGDLTAKVKAAQAILDRGYGRAEQTISGTLSGQVEHVWPAWLSARRLAYQESAQYAEDIVPRELQADPSEVIEPSVIEASIEAQAVTLEAPAELPRRVPRTRPAPAPAPAEPVTPFVPPPRKVWKIGGDLNPAYTSIAKPQPNWVNAVPTRNNDPYWVGPVEPEPYDETDKEKEEAIKRFNMRGPFRRGGRGGGEPF